MKGGVEIGRFNDFSRENYENFKSNLRLSLPHNGIRHYSVVLHTRFDENTQSNANLGELVDTEVVLSSLLLRYEVSEKRTSSIFIRRSWI